MRNTKLIIPRFYFCSSTISSLNVLSMRWLRPAIVKLNNIRAFPSIYRGHADTRVVVTYF